MSYGMHLFYSILFLFIYLFLKFDLILFVIYFILF